MEVGGVGSFVRVGALGVERMVGVGHEVEEDAELLDDVGERTMVADVVDRALRLVGDDAIELAAAVGVLLVARAVAVAERLEHAGAQSVAMTIDLAREVGRRQARRGVRDLDLALFAPGLERGGGGEKVRRSRRGREQATR